MEFKPLSVTASVPLLGLSSTTTAEPVSLKIPPGTEDAVTYPVSPAGLGADGTAVRCRSSGPSAARGLSTGLSSHSVDGFVQELRASGEDKRHDGEEEGMEDWATYGGTSASAPIIASVHALAGTPSAGSDPSEFPYANTSALNDVTSGGNGNRTTSSFRTARTGYDGPTGPGTPEGLGAFPG